MILQQNNSCTEEISMTRESSSSFRHVALMVALLVIVPTTMVSAQDYTVHMTDQDGKTATHYVSRNAVRDVSSSPVETDVIYRLDKGTIIKINHQQKTYTEMTLAEARQLAEKKAGNMSPMQQQMMAHFSAAKPTVTKVGKGGTIAGYATDKYSITTPMIHSESWITPALELPPGYYDMVMASVGSQMGGFGQFMSAMKTSQIKGYLLKSVSTMSNPMMQGVTQSSVATSVEKGQIPASTFEPPAGYRKVSAN
jgi:hypothetical protein